jgi:hypothetical protein
LEVDGHVAPLMLSSIGLSGDNPEIVRTPFIDRDGDRA